MRKRAAALLVCIMLCLSGCSYNQTSVDALLTPPKLSDQQNQIYTALETGVGKTINLIYPQKGDFTSAILINNIDSEPTQEAIVFYETSNSTTAQMPLRMSVLDQEDGKWVSKYDRAIEANVVERVEFVSVNQQIYMVGCFNLITKAEKDVMIFSYQNGILNQTFSISCMDFAVCDLDKDQKSELMAITQNKQGEVKTASANLYQITSSSAKIMAQAPMDPNVTSYSNVKAAGLDKDNQAVYVDGLKGTNNMCTEILTWENDRLVNLIYSEDEEKNLIEKTHRTYGAPSMDINNDGVFEIPIPVVALGYEQMPPLEQQYMTEWYNYRGGELKRLETTYVSYSLGYVFVIPRFWIGKVRIDYLSGANEVSFYDNENYDDYDSKLLTIKVVKRSDYQAARDGGYELLRDNGMLLYTYKIYDTSSKLSVYKSHIVNNFSLL